LNAVYRYGSVTELTESIPELSTDYVEDEDDSIVADAGVIVKRRNSPPPTEEDFTGRWFTLV